MALTDQQLAGVGVGISHHFAGLAYIKESVIPAGSELTQHAHDHDHLSYLVSGTVRLSVDGLKSEIKGPCALTISAHKVHGVEALTDVVWLCVWGTDCTDPEKIDEVLEGKH